jgi:hypothetical protein
VLRNTFHAKKFRSCRCSGQAFLTSWKEESTLTSFVYSRWFLRHIVPFFNSSHPLLVSPRKFILLPLQLLKPPTYSHSTKYSPVVKCKFRCIHRSCECRYCIGTACHLLSLYFCLGCSCSMSYENQIPLLQENIS